MNYDEMSAEDQVACNKVNQALLGFSVLVSLIGLAVGGASLANPVQPQTKPQLICNLVDLKTCAPVFPLYALVKIDDVKHCIGWKDKTKKAFVTHRAIVKIDGKEWCCAG